MIFASIFGYIAGRISYTNKCQEKLMALPNSRFAEMLRRRRQQGRNWDMGTQDAGAATALSLAPFQATTDSYTDEYNKVNFLRVFFVVFIFLHRFSCTKLITAKFIKFGHKPTTLFDIG